MKASEDMSKEEFGKLLDLARKGDVKAQFETGLALRNGWGTEVDKTAAREWFEKSAAGGDADAMLALGHMYYVGDAGERDYDAARGYYANAVTHGRVQAAVAANELHIARAVEDGDFKRAKEQMELRKKIWAAPLSYPLRIMGETFNIFYPKLQNLLAKKISIIPSQADEGLKMSPEGDFWYHIKTNEPDIFAVLFDYYRQERPQFQVIAFYARKHGANREDALSIMEKFRGEFKAKDEGENFGFAYLRDMAIEDFWNKAALSELAKQAEKVYRATRDAEMAFRSLREKAK